MRTGCSRWCALAFRTSNLESTFGAPRFFHLLHSQEEPRMTRAVSLQKHYKIQLKHPLYQGYSRAVALALALCC